MSPDDAIPQRWTNEILEALEESNPATPAELAAALETHPMTVDRRCRDLQRDGYLRRCPGGTYMLSEPTSDRTSTRLAD